MFVNGGNLAVLYCFVLLLCVRRPRANQALTRYCRKRGKFRITLGTRSSSGRPLGSRASRLVEEMSLAIRLRSKRPYQLRQERDGCYESRSAFFRAACQHVVRATGTRTKGERSGQSGGDCARRRGCTTQPQISRHHSRRQILGAWPINDSGWRSAFPQRFQANGYLESQRWGGTNGIAIANMSRRVR